MLFWRRGGGDSYAVRHGHIKLTEQQRGTLELYDLVGDIAEQHDRASDKMDLLKELDALKHEWNAELVPPKWQNPRAGRKQKR